ncbi:MAG: hypothetical protein KDD64_03970 [Bdellovibrionales bacterium]|nr:hypothetical protein [Bdellovibrionales bacterium]
MDREQERLLPEPQCALSVSPLAEAQFNREQIIPSERSKRGESENLLEGLEPVSPLAIRKPTRVGKIIASFVDRFGTNPKASATVLDVGAKLGIDLIPVVGPFKKFADARALYSMEDEKLKRDAKVLLLIAAVELGLDVGTAGGSVFLPDELLTWLRTAKDTQRRLRGAGGVLRFLPDPLSFVGKFVVRSRLVSRVLHFGLSFGLEGPHD